MVEIPDLFPSWRWYGPKDSVSLSDAKQAGAKGIVTALHEIPVGEIWTTSAIEARKKILGDLPWVVVESVNIHESIKKGTSDRDQYIESYQQTIRNLARSNINTICYNFMPVLDWTRTDLHYNLPDGSTALRFDAIALAAFELFILKRADAESNYTEKQIDHAKEYFEGLDHRRRMQLEQTVLAGLPGTDTTIPLDDFRHALDAYGHLDAAGLKQNLAYFLNAVVSVAEEVGVKLAIHPDDPPFPILGLPRVVCTAADINDLLLMESSPNNGLTFCTGSLSARENNDLVSMIERFGDRIHFVHLRSVQREADGSFYEADHLQGNAELPRVMIALKKEQQKRKAKGATNLEIPYRPDHGHQMLDDLGKSTTTPGYSAIGRLKGMAELKGLELGIKSFLSDI